jgi:hypothetical protein
MDEHNCSKARKSEQLGHELVQPWRVLPKVNHAGMELGSLRRASVRRVFCSYAQLTDAIGGRRFSDRAPISTLHGGGSMRAGNLFGSTGTELNFRWTSALKVSLARRAPTPPDSSDDARQNAGN